MFCVNNSGTPPKDLNVTNAGVSQTFVACRTNVSRTSWIETAEIGDANIDNLFAGSINANSILVNGEPISNGGEQFPFNTFALYNPLDRTAILKFDLTSLSTQSTKIFEVPNSDGILPGHYASNTLVLGNTNYDLDTSLSSTEANNTLIGINAGTSITIGFDNVALGKDSLLTLTEGERNTAIGSGAMSMADPFVIVNTAIGFNALQKTQNSQNTAIGAYSLSNSISATNNTAVGYNSLVSSSSGGFNVAIGHSALSALTTGTTNTAIGWGVMSNGNGTQNVAMGYNALRNCSAINNVAIGFQALTALTSGSENIAIGHQAGTNLQTGFQNIIIGRNANVDVSNRNGCIIIGQTAMPNQDYQFVLRAAANSVTNTPMRGLVLLNAGQATVTVSSISANTLIYLTHQTTGSGIPGSLFVSSRSVGVGFDIASSNVADDTMVAYLLIEP